MPKTETKQLADVIEMTGEDSRQVRRIGDAGFYPKPSAKGGYDLGATVRGIIAYYKKQAAKVTDSKAADAARREKSLADMAEIDAAKGIGEVVLKVDYDNDFKDAVAQGVRNISNLKMPGLTTAHKEAVFAALRAIKFGKRE